MEILYKLDSIEYLEIEGVYPVSDDTLFLLRSVKKVIDNGKGRLMDMGCGVGLISLYAAYGGWDVVSVDREPTALQNLRRNLIINDLSANLCLSDLFDGVPRSYENEFDIITFNPPYLPSNEYIPESRSDLALVGGRNGYEVMERFLKEVPRFLKENGQLLVLMYDHWTSELEFGPFRYNSNLGVQDAKDIDGERFIITHLTCK